MIVDINDEAAVKSLTVKHGFSDPAITEKFIMNFNVHELLSQNFESYLHGGLCVPFYVTDPKAKRLSVDLDIFVKNTYEEMAASVPKILTKTRSISCEPRGPKTAKNLLQLVATYPTPRLPDGHRGNMKLDILCSVDTPIPTRKISRGHELFIGKTAHDVTAVTPGFLLADKVTALSTNTIGYPVASKVPKQVHDIGYLLSSANRDDLADAITTFEPITTFKANRHPRKFQIIDIISGVSRLMHDLIPISDTVSLQTEYLNHFARFKQIYLSRKIAYDDNELKSNILKTWLYALCVTETIACRANADAMAKLVFDSINAPTNHTKSTGSRIDDKNIIEDLRNWHPGTNFTEESLKNLHLLHSISKITQQYTST